MGEGARGREAERAGLHALLDDRRHLLDVFGVGFLILRAAVAHHIGADRAVRDLRADVDGHRQGLEEVEVFGEGLPAPLHALGEGAAGDVLDALHEADQPVALVRRGGREADAAVAHHDGGDTVPERRREQRVPGDLPVEVGVDVDEAGGDEQAVGVDLFTAAVGHFADDRDEPVIDRDISVSGRRTGAVDDESVADYQVMHGGPLQRRGTAPRTTAQYH